MFYEKENFYYIDESGHILNNSKLFIHGCIKTDTPKFISKALDEIKVEIQNDYYFNEFMDEFKETGFHAVDNHFDIRTLLYRKLITLNWRAYFVLINKESDYFNSIKDKPEHEIFKISLSKLLFNRLRSESSNKNILNFETIDLSGKPLSKVLEELFIPWTKRYNCEYFILNKDDDVNLGVIDYLNYILYRILTTNDRDEVMRRNFNNLAPKIALIHIQNTNTYLSRSKEEITVENLLKNW